MFHPTLKQQFLLDPEITFLNFGSFGACPNPVFEDYRHWQTELERSPVQFITVKAPELLQQSRAALSHYISCDSNDVVLVTNPSYGLNIVAKSFKLNKGDEILTTDLEYGASDKIWNYYCEKSGANYVRQKIELPIVSKEKFIEDFFKGLSKNTKAIFISHITSSTALILPVKEICELAKQKGLITIVDGAHAPAQIPLNLNELEADIYTGACHKWMLCPKGCSFLYIRKELQDQFDPLLISWGFQSAAPSSSRFIDYHQMQGTRDLSAFLTLPAAIRFLEENKWTQVSEHCRELVKSNAQRFCDLLHTQSLAPLSDEFIGQMLSIPLKTMSAERLQRYLFQTYNIEIPVISFNGRSYLRYSINAFNSQSDLDKLYDALSEILHVTSFIEV